MKRGPRRRIAAIGLLLVLAGIAGCVALNEAGREPSSSASTFARDFVAVNGASFELAGRPFRFVGVNIYDAAATNRYSCRSATRMSDAQLLGTLRTLHDQAGATVLRFWAYQTYTRGATDWRGVDQVLAAALTVGMKVIPVLEDGPGDCTTGETRTPKARYQGDSWFSHGYTVPYGNATLSYRDYVAKITAHYANNRTILGWSMMNEAETSARTASDTPVLVNFATDIAAVIRSADRRHLITVGTQSNGAPGASGPDFSAVYGLSQISFAEVHDWGYWGSDTQPMPGGVNSKPPAATSRECAAANAPVGCSFARAAALDKPLVIGEAGMRGVSGHDRELRASRLRAKLDAAFAAGASGYLIWSVTTAETDGYDLRVGTGDPLMVQLKEVAAKIG